MVNRNKSETYAMVRNYNHESCAISLHMLTRVSRQSLLAQAEVREDETNADN